MERKLVQIFFSSAALGLAIVILVLSALPAAYRPETGAPHDIEHAGAFALLGVTTALGYPLRMSGAVSLGIGFAAAIEIIQIGIPTRHARLEDFWVDAGSVAIGYVIAAVIKRLGNPTRTGDAGSQR